LSPVSVVESIRQNEIKPSKRTHYWAEKLGIAVKLGRHTCESGAESVTGFNELLTNGNLSTESLAFRSFRIENRKRAITSIVRYRGHLDVRVRETVREDDRSDVDVLQPRSGSNGELLISIMDNFRDVGSVCATIAFRSEVERFLGVLGETVHE